MEICHKRAVSMLDRMGLSLVELVTLLVKPIRRQFLCLVSVTTMSGNGLERIILIGTFSVLEVKFVARLEYLVS